MMFVCNACCKNRIFLLSLIFFENLMQGIHQQQFYETHFFLYRSQSKGLVVQTLFQKRICFDLSELI
jgi:hypothetical protein